MSLFEKDGEIFKSVPAGGHGGGVTSYATVKASEAEAAAFRAAQEPAAEPDTASESELKQDGPTVQEWVAEGYTASKYPPQGYASKSSAEDIAAAIAAEIEADKLKQSKT